MVINGEVELMDVVHTMEISNLFWPLRAEVDNPSSC
jgi:hypothetical protein